MIDDTNYADCLALYNFDHVEKIKGKESFSYIFNDNINYIRSLYNKSKIRNATYDNIQKRFFVALSILAIIFLFALIAIRKLLFLTNVILSFVLLVVLKKLRFVLLISLLSLLMPNIVISFLPSLIF